jgi:hypothetical protein
MSAASLPLAEGQMIHRFGNASVRYAMCHLEAEYVACLSTARVGVLVLQRAG